MSVCDRDSSQVERVRKVAVVLFEHHVKQEVIESERNVDDDEDPAAQRSKPLIGKQICLLFLCDI